jgi:hypothetical protein
MKPDLGAEIDRRSFLASLAGASALTSVPSLISGTATAAPEIVTNAGLNPGLPHVGELARRLDYALRERKVFDHIARTQSRHFALGSVTLNAQPSEQLILDFQTLLDRQSEFVSRSFGPLALDDLPVYIATSLHDDRVVRDAVLDVLVYITCKSGFWRDAKIVRAFDVFCVAKAPRYHADSRGARKLDLIALWPLETHT